MPSGKSFGIASTPAPYICARITLPATPSVKRSKPVNIPIPGIDTNTFLINWQVLRNVFLMRELLWDFCFFRGERSRPESMAPPAQQNAGPTPDVNKAFPQQFCPCCTAHATCNNVEDCISAIGSIADFYFIVSYQLWARLNASGNKKKRLDNLPEKLELLVVPDVTETISFKKCLRVSTLSGPNQSSVHYLTLHKSLLPGTYRLFMNAFLNVENPLIDTDAFLCASNTNVMIETVFQNFVTIVVTKAINVDEGNTGFLLGRIDSKFIDVIYDLGSNYKLLSVRNNQIGATPLGHLERVLLTLIGGNIIAPTIASIGTELDKTFALFSASVAPFVMRNFYSVIKAAVGGDENKVTALCTEVPLDFATPSSFMGYENLNAITFSAPLKYQSVATVKITCELDLAVEASIIQLEKFATKLLECGGVATEMEMADGKLHLIIQGLDFANVYAVYEQFFTSNGMFC